MTSNIPITVLHTILDSVVEGILVVDSDNKITLFNSRFSKMWEIPLEILEHRDDDKLIKYVLDQLLEPEFFTKKVKLLYGSNLEDCDELKFKDGKIFERTSFPLVQGNEKPGRVWSFRDITDDVNKNIEIKQYKDHLEELVIKRTIDLEQANTKLEAFNYSTSHDLQAPLRSIDVYSAILFEEYKSSLDDKGKNCIDRIRESTKQMGSLIENLISTSKVSDDE